MKENRLHARETLKRNRHNFWRRRLPIKRLYESQRKHLKIANIIRLNSMALERLTRCQCRAGTEVTKEQTEDKLNLPPTRPNKKAQVFPSRGPHCNFPHLSGRYKTSPLECNSRCISSGCRHQGVVMATAVCQSEPHTRCTRCNRYNMWGPFCITRGDRSIGAKESKDCLGRFKAPKSRRR